MMGTGEFALPTFLSLYDTPHQVVGLVTQPDREGRGHHHHPHPMKDAALERETPVFQPERVNTPEALEKLREFDADVFLVAAYGQILSQELLEIPRLGAYNIHASLLPKYRGAAPIQYAIWKGETETGITMFRIEPKLDAGPIVGREKIPIGPKETYGELQDRLADSSVTLTKRVLDQLAADQVELETQNAELVTKAPRLKKADGEIVWSQSAEEIGWHLRAMQPWPSPYTFFHQEGRKKSVRLIVLDADPFSPDQLPEGTTLPADVPPGSVVHADQHHLVVQTGDGYLELQQLRPEGKRDMPAEDFLHGHSVKPGDRLGPKA